MSIQNFTDLVAWQEGHKLVLLIYDATKLFPKEETFSLTDQMKRAAVSITSNIAEGFSRKSILEKKHFFYLAKGSLTEIQNQLLIAKDVCYIDQVKYDEINKKSISVGKLINSLLKYMESGKFVPHT